MLQLIQLRWLAIGGQIATISIVQLGFGIALPMLEISTVLVLFIAFNFASFFRWRIHDEFDHAELFVALLVDVATLTALLYLCGGAANPFAALYLLHVMLSAVLLPAWSTWTIVAITGSCFLGLTHWFRPLDIPLDYTSGLASPYVRGTWLCFLMNATLLVFFVGRITRNLRARDARLADMRQHAAEQEHIVRMGLLASGAAHELGTPLSTLSVILGDWRRAPALGADAELRHEIEVMEAQLTRCKTIVGGILLSAGEMQGLAPVQTTLHRFLGELVEHWRESRAAPQLRLVDDFGPDVAIVSDTALRQMIDNVLDNALEVSPAWIELRVARRGDDLELAVLDAGPGFEPSMLAEIGKPYRSSKGRPGGGLGLFLVVNVARTLGGRVEARNRSQGGAAVTMTLPLAALMIEPLADDASEAGGGDSRHAHAG